MIDMSCVMASSMSFIVLCHPYSIEFCWNYELSLAVTVFAVEIIRLLPKMASASESHQGAAKSLKILTPCLLR